MPFALFRTQFIAQPRLAHTTVGGIAVQRVILWALNGLTFVVAESVYT
jgi:hypothetical protein